MALEHLKLISVNVGRPKVIGNTNGEDVLSGIDKHPVDGGAVFVRRTGIDGDGQADLENHGGIEKAVYAYPTANWPWWEGEMKVACRPALFGENLTLSGVDETGIRIGDRCAWGDAVLEVSQPRAPCFKLDIHTARPNAAQMMTLTGRCGWYLRVLEEGAAPVSGALALVHRSDSPTVREAFSTVFSSAPDIALLRRIHAAPAISPAWRRRAEKKLRAAGAG